MMTVKEALDIFMIEQNASREELEEAYAFCKREIVEQKEAGLVSEEEYRAKVDHLQRARQKVTRFRPDLLEPEEPRASKALIKPPPSLYGNYGADATEEASKKPAVGKRNTGSRAGFEPPSLKAAESASTRNPTSRLFTGNKPPEHHAAQSLHSLGRPAPLNQRAVTPKKKKKPKKPTFEEVDDGLPSIRRIVFLLMIIGCGGYYWFHTQFGGPRMEPLLENSPPATMQGFAIPDVLIEMVWAPAGEFVMGSPEDEPGRRPTEGPQTEVVFNKGFWIGKHEVTQGQYSAIMGTNPSRFPMAGLSAPVEKVTYRDAMAFCERLTERESRAGRLLGGYTYRLPTEMEWEYACRALTVSATYVGDLEVRGVYDSPTLSPIAWYGGNSKAEYPGAVDVSNWQQKQFSHTMAGPQPVGGKRPNGWGIYDMMGNVWEWCYNDFSNALPGTRLVDPKPVPANENWGVVRGGSWSTGASSCRSASRRQMAPTESTIEVGFRIVMVKE